MVVVRPQKVDLLDLTPYKTLDPLCGTSWTYWLIGEGGECRVWIICELRVDSCECELRVTSCELKFASCELDSAS